MLVLPPDAAARKQILEIHSRMRNVPIDPMGLNFEQIAVETYMWTGAELQKLVISSAYKALEADAKYVTLEHFEQAMEDIEVNEKERKATIEKMIQDMLRTEASVSRAFLKKEMDAFQKAEGGKADRTLSFVDSLKDD